MANRLWMHSGRSPGPSSWPARQGSALASPTVLLQRDLSSQEWSQVNPTECCSLHRPGSRLSLGEPVEGQVGRGRSFCPTASPPARRAQFHWLADPGHGTQTAGLTVESSTDAQEHETRVPDGSTYLLTCLLLLICSSASCGQQKPTRSLWSCTWD